MILLYKQGGRQNRIHLYIRRLLKYVYYGELLRAAKMTLLSLNQRKFIVEEMAKTGSIAGTLRKFRIVNGFKTNRETVQKNFQKWHV